MARRRRLPRSRSKEGPTPASPRDTVVDLDDVVLEKPSNELEADLFLTRMGNRWHTVWTGLHLVRLRDERAVAGVESSRVFFSELDAETRRRYIETGEPMDKAGGYGIQGYGGLFVPRIEGDYFNVMGLPLALLRRLCHELEEFA
ncbi:MAG: Maf family protein [Candidatus Eisenbacteria bacterium]